MGQAYLVLRYKVGFLIDSECYLGAMSKYGYLKMEARNTRKHTLLCIFLEQFHISTLKIVNALQAIRQCTQMVTSVPCLPEMIVVNYQFLMLNFRRLNLTIWAVNCNSSNGS